MAVEHEGISLREYARRRGVTLAAVQKARDTGRIPVLPNGRINPAAADAAWDSNTEPVQQARGVTGGSAPKEYAQQVREPSVPAPRGEGPAAGSLAAAQAVRFNYQARMARLDYEQRIGKLVNADEVRKAAFDAGRILREKLFNMADRLASVLAAESDPIKVHRALTDEFRAVLSDAAERRPAPATAEAS
jgi:hypothetical protein